MSAIKAIYGMEPPREGECPTVHVVGSESFTPGGARFNVTRIERREENYGDHGLLWFDVIGPDGNVVTSMQGRAVAEVHYFPAESA